MAACAVILAGCSSGHYRRSADRDTYRIIQQVERRVFGVTNAFTIDTRFSGRDPASIRPEEIIGDRSTTNRWVMRLEDALAQAVRTSREYQAQKEQLYLSALSLTGARYEFSPQFVADAEGTVSGTGDTVGTGRVNSQVGVSQLLKSGGRLSLALGNDLLRYFTAQFRASPGQPPVSIGNDSAINQISLNLTQPLLRGFGVNDPRVESLTQAERNVAYAVRTFSLYQQQFAVDTVNAYFDLLTRKDVVRNNYRNYTNRVETTRYLEARAVDRERQSNVDDSRTAELSARTSYINSLAGYLSAVDSFKLRLGLPVSHELFLDDRDLDELTAAGLAPVDIDRQVAFARCVEAQMDVLNAIDRFEDSQRKVRLAADQLKPGMNFFARADVSSEEPYDYTKFDPDKIRYSFGLQLDLPVDRLRERNSYRSTLISFESQLRSLALTLDNFKDRIDRGLRSVEQARLNYLNGLEQLKVAERRVDNNAMLLEAGRATIRDLREAQDSLILAQNNLSTLVTGYLASRLQLLVNIGMLDTRPAQFWLHDPLQALPAEQRSAPPLRMPDDQVLAPDTYLEPAT